MSARHPVIAITGSSGAGTSTVTRTFQHIFRREGVNPVIVEGDAFHRYDREEMKEAMAREAADGNDHFSHFGSDANLFEELETLFCQYGNEGSGRVRKYLHNDAEAAPYGQPAGTFTPWEDIPPGTDILFYEGLHGAVKTDKVDIAQHVDLRIGVVPIINLEWIQKLHRDREQRGYTTDAVTDTILRRMPEYVHYICSQFENTHINFQRVPMVDTSNPFIARSIPTPEESMVVIRFANPRGIDFQYLLAMMGGAFMSRANTIVIPGGKIDLAMQLIFTPLILRLVENGRKARARY
ncbi:phosphoribulokinase [Methyloversatilis universalis]|uniref:phosphoribulokinase n=1 Tax=Methyloversatilis universalis TaxID=378211 RepID=UPI00037D94DB|nr:phosphoribulokinase [Methyloversatilis universalis]